MYFSTTSIAGLIALASSTPTAFASPVVPRDGTFSYGSPGIIVAKAFSLAPGAATCNGKAPIPQGPTVRLPKEWMNNSRCGKPVTVYYRPRVDDVGMAESPGFQVVVATIYGTCTDCKSHEISFDRDLFQSIWSTDSEEDGRKGTWGPAVVFGTP